MRKKIIKYSILLFAGLALYFVVSTYQKLAIVTGYTSKYMCSCLFSAGREKEDIISLDLATGFVSLAEFEIDAEKKQVSSTIWGFQKNTSIYRSGFGCALLADHSEEKVLENKFPFPRRKRLIDDTASWPTGNQVYLSEKEKTIQEKMLQVISSEFKENREGPFKNTTAITVAYDGKLLAEKYRNGFDKHTPVLGWSMTKSITSTLIGILVQEGKLNIHDPAPIKEWQNDERKSITLHHLLQMTSGLDWEEEYSKISEAVTMLYKKGDMYAYSIQPKLKYEAGTKWYYSSGTSNILSGIIRNQFANSQDYWSFPYEALFNKIGMSSVILETDASGTFVASSYCYATPRDWTRYGLLYYNQGVWQGDTVVDPSWVTYTSTTSENIPLGQYGAQWWLNGKANGENKFPALPEDMIMCRGYQGQHIYVIPSKKLVVTRFGKTSDRSAFDEVAFLQGIFNCLPK